MNENYYLIKQSFPYLDTKINKIYCPCNMKHLKKLISFMTGTIEVYLYNEENGMRKDLTSSLGNRDFNLYENRFERISTVKMAYSHKYLQNKYFSFYALMDIRLEYLANFFMNDYVYSIKGGIEHRFDRRSFSCDLEDQKKRLKYGNDYEKFISNKYESLGYKVELRGVSKSFNDGGLDIIAKKENNMVLIQCKNWKMSNNYKINQKDIRAFIGDCYLYLKDINLEGLKVSYHFIVSHNNILTKPAEIFLEQNNFVKFKCVPFE